MFEENIVCACLSVSSSCHESLTETATHLYPASRHHSLLDLPTLQKDRVPRAATRLTSHGPHPFPAEQRTNART